MGITLWISCLNHEALDDSVEQVVVVETITTVYTEILHGLWTPGK